MDIVKGQNVSIITRAGSVQSDQLSVKMYISSHIIVQYMSNIYILHQLKETFYQGFYIYLHKNTIVFNSIQNKTFYHIKVLSQSEIYISSVFTKLRGVRLQHCDRKHTIF